MIPGSPPIVPKAPDGPLRVIVIGSLAQVAAYLDSVCHGRVMIRVYPASGSSRKRRQQALREILPVLHAGDTDLVIASDATRIARDPWSQFEFAEEARRLGTRVIFASEGIDTSLDSWELRQEITAVASRIRRVPSE